MYAQFTYPNRMVLVRAASGEPLALVPQIAQALRRADPDLAMFDVQTMEGRAALSWSKTSFQTALLVVIALIALYAQRHRCLCRHVASGDEPHPRDRRAHGTRREQPPGRAIDDGADAAVRVAVEQSPGCLARSCWGGVLRATLYETSPLDPVVLAGAVSVLIAVAAAATYVPLRRALRVNPVDVLRSE